MKRFHSSYAIRSRFYLKLTMVNLNESRKDRELEGSNQHHAKALGERPTSGAGRPRIAQPACTCGRSLWPFYRCAGSVCNAPGKLLRSIGWKVQAGRPGVVRPAWIPFGIHLNFSGTLVQFSSFELTAHSAKDQSRGVVGTHMCTNHKSTRRNNFLFLFHSNKVGCCCIQMDELNKWNKGI
jgi:hypothetical protein